MARLLVIVVNYKSARLALRAADSVLAERADIPELELVIVENDSGDAEELRQGLQQPRFAGWARLVVAPKNGGFAYGNNLAVREALASPNPPPYYLLLNPDTEVKRGALRKLLDFIEQRPEVGIIGPKIVHEDGKDEGVAFRFPSVWGELERGAHFGPITRVLKDHIVAQKMGDEPTPVDWVFGAAMIVRAEVFARIGLMDETYFLYYEETDFCLAAQRAGFQTWYFPQAEVVHFAGQSTGVTVRDQQKRRLPTYWFESRRRFFAKNFGLGYAARADVALWFGAALFRVRMAVDPKARPETPHLLTDLVRHSAILPSNWRVLPAKTT